MKTLVRILDEQQTGSQYKHLYIQLLRYRYPNAEYTEVFGTISFQKGGLTNIEGMTMDHWYAMKIECISDNAQDFIDCARILKAIKDNRDCNDPQPKEVLAIIGAVEFVIFQGDWIPKSYNGYKRYNVMSEDGTCYTRVFAPSEKLAQAKLAKKRLVNKTLVFDTAVNF